MAASGGTKAALTNVLRFALATVFTLSGFVKAIDPLGTQYKMQEYLHALPGDIALPDWATLAAAVLLAAVEFAIGVFLLFAIRRRLASRTALLFMAVMTPFTLWLALANPVSDCGCFGDALVLTNWQTFWKNVALLAAAAVVAHRTGDMVRFIGPSSQWIVINYTVLFVLALSAWSLYDLPPFDFRPYHVGANIKEGMEMPDGAKAPTFEITFIMERDGVRKEFSLDDYPDSTWTFVDARTVQTSEGYVPPIHDFSIVTQEGMDITDEVLADTSYTFLLVSPHLEHADDSRLDLINEVYEYAHEHGYAFYCLTASGDEAIAHWRDQTGAEYPFCSADETTLKTVIRSNPGLLLVKGATVVRKWSHNRLPAIPQEEASKPLHQLDMGKMPSAGAAPRTALRIALWFALPLLALTIADRTWAWTRWVRRRKRSVA